ncbi:RfeD [Purpureocillium lavendulum]|uniref:RfeD n=1 Tax=Purpureocillium lavendulum TaxID=1247861 RepID=A0AB34G4A8_9HYPO|nr:RfeD [Purpureocillium lavendulum]
MPPRSSLTSSFSITDASNEVVCPLRNQDGSSCRKRCVGPKLQMAPVSAGRFPPVGDRGRWLTVSFAIQEKRFRSMQEHIRRAHPEHYIPKLPATEESFTLMVNSPPQERRNDQPTSATQSLNDRGGYYRDTSSNPALAELHGIKSERDIDMDGGYYSDTDGRRIPRSSIELPPLNLSHNDITSDPFSGNRPREILPSLMAHSPPGRSSTLPPLQRPLGPSRPRKQSVSKRGREPHHKKKNSRGQNIDLFRRLQNEEHMRYGGFDRKALSAEPSADRDKRWADLIDAAAASAAGDLDDRTPVPQSPVSIQRGSLPPFQHPQPAQPTSYQASPLQQALTPPSFNQDVAEPFPSVESGESGDTFHMGSQGLSESSPSYGSSQNIQIYCAACQGVSQLKNSYACTECICGLCSTCVGVLMAEQGAHRKCPRCATIGGRFKPFQLEIR